MRVLTLIFLSAALLTRTALAQSVINGFGDGSQFTLNNQSYNPPTTISNGVLNLTSATQSVAASAFYSTPVSIEQFTVSFTFTHSDVNQTPGDGFTFAIHNDPRGPSALGASGGYLGYAGISPSAAFGFNLYPGYALGTFVLDSGSVPINAYNQFASASFSNGVPYTVTLSYANGMLLSTITGADLATPLQSSYSIAIPSLVGSTSAYVGFTGGTGGAVTAISISDLTLSVIPEPSSWAMLASGLAFVGWAGWHRRRS